MFKDWSIDGEERLLDLKNMVAIGIVDDGKFLSSIFTLDDLLLKVLKYNTNWTYADLTEEPRRKAVTMVHQRFLVCDWAIPLSHYNGIITFVIRKDDTVYLASI